jgi:type IV pilus assembly protein PilB
MPPTPPSLKPDPSNPKYVEAELKGRRFGRALAKLGKATREQVHEALALQQGAKKGKRLGEIMVEMGLLTQQDVVMTLAGMMGVPYASLRERSLSEDTLKAIRSTSIRPASGWSSR